MNDIILVFMANLEEIKKKVRSILKKYGIQKAGVFGSASRGKAEVNDVDLLVNR